MALLTSSVLQKLLISGFLLIAVFRHPDPCESQTPPVIRCHYCNEAIDHGKLSGNWANCVFGGFAKDIVGSDGQSKPTTYPCGDTVNTEYVPGLCRMKISWRPDYLEMDKGCVFKQISYCFENGKVPTAVKKGNCWVVPSNNYPSHYPVEKCAPKVNDASSPTDASSRNSEDSMTAFCTCQGQYCNEHLSDADYEAIGAPKPEKKTDQTVVVMDTTTKKAVKGAKGGASSPRTMAVAGLGPAIMIFVAIGLSGF